MEKILIPILFFGLLGLPTAYGQDIVQVYALALQHDAQLKAAKATRDALFETKSQAKALLFPAVALTGTVDRVHSQDKGSLADDYINRTLSLSLSQAVYRSDYMIQLKQADQVIAQAEVEYLAEEQAVIIRVAQAYFGVLSAADMLDFAKAENAAIARQLDQAKQRFEVGLIAITAVHETQATFDQSRADLIQAENALYNAREVLGEIVYEEVDEVTSLAEDLPLNLPEPNNVDQWGEVAQQQNLTIQATLREVEIARQNIKLMRSEYRPAVDLVGSHSLSRTGSSDGTASDDTSFGLELSLPLYTGGRIASNTRQAQFEFEAAQETLDQQRRAVNRQVRDAYRGVLTGISVVKALKASILSAQSALEATKAGFEVGTRTMVDVLNAQSDLFHTRSNYANVRYEYILSGLELKQAAGTLSGDDLKKINTWLH